MKPVGEPPPHSLSPSLIPAPPSPLEETWVALDVETTGLSPDEDEVIEVGAVKFQGEQVLDTYQTFVNPRRRLSDFVKRYTGIGQRDVARAPLFHAISSQLAAFIGEAPIVGHNLGFDMGFLAANGLRLSNPRCDTWDLAFVFLPEAQDYSLDGLCESLGISRSQRHRATADATATCQLFVKLVRKAWDLDEFALAEMERLARRSSWVLAYLLGGLATAKVLQRSALTSAPSQEQQTAVGIAGVDTHALRERLKRGRPLRPEQRVQELDVDFVGSQLAEGGALSKAIPEFEERPEQIAMARAVAAALNEGKRFVVEAGTGVGKSLAYLLPAVLYALKSNKRVVVSTNTINLQEQLLTKDMPTLVQALAHLDDVPVEDLRYAQLKGRVNYLCFRRWSYLRSLDTVSETDGRLLAKVLVWLRSTATGDRSELNLSHRGTAAAWDRLSAQGALECPWSGGPCFLRSARDAAAASHLVIVNHALLLSDIVAGGALIPPYDVLIVDEGQHLEEEATRQLGFEVRQSGIDERLQSLSGDRGLLREVVSALGRSRAKVSQREAAEKISSQAAILLPEVRDRVARMFAVLGGIFEGREQGGAVDGPELRITRSTRAQPAWSQVEIQWQHVDVALTELGHNLQAMQSALDGLEDAGLINYEGLVMEVSSAVQANSDLRQMLAEVIPHPKADGIYWAARGGRDGDISLHAAPLHVGGELDRLLFSQKECVVMTGATLSTNETFEHIVGRTGLKDADELLLGSPFDFANAALVCVPEDMPEPSWPAYGSALQRAVTDAAIAAGGRTMALFTSHASLQAVASAVRADLRAHGIDVLAQGVDGTPHQILRQFMQSPSSLLLGTASFWEGVDLAGDSLQVLLLARLPFSVPTEPVFAARSELFEQPFYEYAVPQAVLRLRQGFGRLIRTKTDKGVVGILDRRIISRGYGKSFLGSLPPATFRTCRLDTLGYEIKDWIGR